MDLFSPRSPAEMAARLSAEEATERQPGTDLDRPLGDADLAAAGLAAMAMAPHTAVPVPPPTPCPCHVFPILPPPPVLPEWNPMDELWRSAETGAGLFVGNRTAAVDKAELVRHNISTVVVCAGEQKRHHEGAPGFHYLTFLVANWQQALAGLVDRPDADEDATSTTAAAGAAPVTTPKRGPGPEPDPSFPATSASDVPPPAPAASAEWPSMFRTTARPRGEHTRHKTARATPTMAAEYFAPVVAAVEAAFARGESVLIHCMVGAHRAGTVGLAVVVRLSARARRRYAPYDEILAAARRRRPLLEPDFVAQGVGVSQCTCGGC